MHIESYPAREATLGDLTIARLLPVRGRRLVGPWCFLDRFGPLTLAEGTPMDVGPHPHVGIQTVTWLLDGEVLHDDSLGSEALAVPGSVNVMTTGHGIAHAEQTPGRPSAPDVDARGRHLNGAQLWVALPDAVRNSAPAFQHVAEVPAADLRGGIVRPFSGALGGVTSPALHHSPIVGADLVVHRGERLAFDVPRGFEHALLLLDGDATVADTVLLPRVLYYLGPGHTELALDSRDGARLLLIGGTPFDESILMWWNFVARTPEEIAAARADWMEGRRFGSVPGSHGHAIEAPPLARFASRQNPR